MNENEVHSTFHADQLYHVLVHSTFHADQLYHVLLESSK